MESEKKVRTSEAQKRASKKYLSEKVEDIRFRVPRGKKAYYKETATANGQSLNQFIIDAIEEKISRMELGVHENG